MVFNDIIIKKLLFLEYEKAIKWTEDYMNNIKKLVLLALSVIFVYAFSVICFAGTWSSYFGYNAHETEYYYEATEGSLTYDSSTGFTANLTKIGWQGVWGCQIYKSVNIGYGGQYNISFKIKSSNVDKYVYIKFSERNQNNNAYSFWVKCPKGQTVSVNRTFTAKTNTSTVIFGLGGDYGDRLDSYDSDSSYRYSLFESQFGISSSKLKDLDTQPGNAASSTEITVSNFSFNTIVQPQTTGPSQVPTVAPRSNNNYSYNYDSDFWDNTPKPKKSVKKPSRVKLKKVRVRKNRVTVSWKKAKNAVGYQVKVGSKTKYTKKRTITVKVKYGKKRVKVRGYSKGKKKYGKWSRTKTVNVKRPVLRTIHSSTKSKKYYRKKLYKFVKKHGYRNNAGGWTITDSDENVHIAIAVTKKKITFHSFTDSKLFISLEMKIGNTNKAKLIVYDSNSLLSMFYSERNINCKKFKAGYYRYNKDESYAVNKIISRIVKVSFGLWDVTINYGGLSMKKIGFKKLKV